MQINHMLTIYINLIMKFVTHTAFRIFFIKDKIKERLR